MNDRPSYLRVFFTFARNSLVRDMQFRSNFLIQCVASTSWVFMNLGFYILIFREGRQIGVDPGWGKYQFFVFLATTMLINSLVQAFFMPNAQQFSEMIRTGDLDFALLKPIDTQFLVSLQRINWPSLSNFALGVGLLGFSLWKLTRAGLVLSPAVFAVYPFYILSGVAILYSLMITLASTSIYLGRNQSLYNFWFYITNFSRYPMEIYRGTYGDPLRWFFTFIIPVLVVVNVPARLMAGMFDPRQPWEWFLLGFAVVATPASLAASRWVFSRALLSYRSASS